MKKKRHLLWRRGAGLVLLVASVMMTARAFAQEPPAEECFVFCDDECACEPAGVCTGRNCPGACQCQPDGCPRAGCQNCVVQACACPFWGCLLCGPQCSNGMPACGGGSVICEFGGCLANGCENNVCPDICPNAADLPCGPCDCGNQNPPPDGCSCGNAVCSNAAECIVNCNGGCAGFDCECVATCQMPQCGGGAWQPCPCDGVNCDEWGLTCPWICDTADNTACGAAWVDPPGAWQGGARDCTVDPEGCRGYGCVCGRYCINAGRPCTGTIACSSADGCVNATANNGSPAPCSAQRHAHCSSLGGAFTCDRPVCTNASVYPCELMAAVDGVDHGGWCCAGCGGTGKTYSGCPSAVDQNGYGLMPYCEVDPNLHCRCGNCRCTAKTNSQQSCGCNPDQCAHCELDPQGGRRRCSIHCDLEGATRGCSPGPGGLCKGAGQP